jgi:hypothetical protein
MIEKITMNIKQTKNKERAMNQLIGTLSIR